MPTLTDAETGKPLDLAPDSALQAFTTGKANIPDGPVFITGPDNNVYKMDPQKVQQALEEGGNFSSDADIAAAKYRESANSGIFSQVGSTTQAFGKSLLNQFFWGLPKEEMRLTSHNEIVDPKTKELTPYGENLVDENMHPYASYAGGATGNILGIVDGAPVANVIGKAGDFAERGISSLIEQFGPKTGNQIIKSIAGKTAKFGTEGAIVSAPYAALDSVLGDHETVAEALLAGAHDIATGAEFGGALGAGIGTLSPAVKSTVGVVLGALSKKPLNEALQEASDISYLRGVGAMTPEQKGINKILQTIGDPEKNMGLYADVPLEIDTEGTKRDPQTLAQMRSWGVNFIKSLEEKAGVTSLTPMASKATKLSDYITNEALPELNQDMANILNKADAVGGNSVNPYPLLDKLSAMEEDLGRYPATERSAKTVSDLIDTIKIAHKDAEGFAAWEAEQKAAQEGAQVGLDRAYEEAKAAYRNNKMSVDQYFLILEKNPNFAQTGKFKDQITAEAKPVKPPEILKNLTPSEFRREVQQNAQKLVWGEGGDIKRIPTTAEAQAYSLIADHLSNTINQLSKSGKPGASELPTYYRALGKKMNGLMLFNDKIFKSIAARNDARSVFNAFDIGIGLLGGGHRLIGSAVGMLGNVLRKQYGAHLGHMALSGASKIVDSVGKDMNEGINQAMGFVPKGLGNAKYSASAQLLNQLTGDKEPDQRKALQTVTNVVSKLSTDPEAMQRVLDSVYPNTHHMGDNLKPIIAQKFAKIINHLNERAPKPTQVPSALNPRPFVPSAQAVANYNREVQAAISPVSVLREMGSGLSTPAQIQTVKELHPKLYAAAQQMIVQKLPYAKDIHPTARNRLSSVVEIPNIIPKSVQVLQANFIPKKVGKPGANSKITESGRAGLDSNRVILEA